MKKIVASVGLVALGTSFVGAVENSALTSMQNNKAWSVSASLRGFFDDNINTASSDKKCSAGFEINPSINYGRAGEQTSVNFTYAFSAKYYGERPANSSDNFDYTHTFGIVLAHAFTPRTSAEVRNSFVIGQEPDILRAGNQPFASTERISGSNLRNYAAAKVNTQVTDLLGFEVGYDNTIFDYEDAGFDASGPSNSGLLDRMEHGGHIDSRWRVSEVTTGIFGYRYGQTDYTGDEIIGGGVGTNAFIMSDARNSRSHYVYGGVEHAFTPDLSGSVRAGAIATDYYNDPNADLNWDPYLSASLQYAYQPESTISAGISLDRSASDVGATGGADFVRDTQTTVLYASLAHRITSQLSGNVSGTWQHAVYNGGGTGTDGKAVDYYLLGMSLEYRLSPNLSTRVGYNLDHVESGLDSGNDYNRNRFYIGVTATY